ncbi:MAG: HlyC/CorC family transporter [Acidimicrobiales bacterium]|nr:HlyC/CorC family transporter [Acidimicrobiales bacterium]MCB1259069.1 HlyC/CorC family transporter [Acidimicrobiales bacterium]
MTTAELVMVITIVVMLLASAFLALAETALTHISRARAQALAEEGRKGAADLAALLERPERFLNPVLLVVLVCQLVQATLTGILADRWFGPWGVAVATFINVVVVFVVAESAPKTWALLHGDRAALAVARPVRWLIASAPVRLASRALIGLTNVILPGKGLPDGPFVTEEEILAMADEAVRGEVLEAEEAEMIEQIIEFGDTVVREVMVPRPDMVAVPSTFRIADVMEVAILNGYSRIPAEGADIDDIVGIVHAKDLMRAERDGHGDEAVSSVLREARYVPETKRIAELLREMQAQQYHLAIVVDEYGGTAGLVTLEDLIEELVGEIVDEFDREEASLEPVPGGAVRVVARMPVHEVNELLHLDLPTDGDWDTVGGLMLHLAGKIPSEGESVAYDDVVLRAERVSGRRIGKVRISRPGGTPLLRAVDGAERTAAPSEVVDG